MLSMNNSHEHYMTLTDIQNKHMFRLILVMVCIPMSSSAKCRPTKSESWRSSTTDSLWHLRVL